MAEGFYSTDFGSVYSRDGKAWLKSPAGLVAVDPSEVDAKLRTGVYKPAGRDEALAQAANEARSTLGQQALTAAESFGAGALDLAQAPLTLPVKAGAALLGQPDPTQAIGGRATIENAVSLGGSVGEALGADQTGEALAHQYAQGVRERAAANPGTALVGNLLGQAVGGGPLARGLGALGGVATEALGGGVAAGLGTRAVTGAIEGAAYGGAQANEDSYIPDRQLTSEQLLSHLGAGAFIGGLVGLGAEGVTQAVKARRVPAAAVVSGEAEARIPANNAAVSEAATAGPLQGEPAAPNLASTWRKIAEDANAKLATVQSAATGADRETLQKFSPLNPANWAKTEDHPYDLLHNRVKILEGATQDVTAGVQALTEKAQAVGREVWEAPAKAELVAKNLAADGFVAGSEKAAAASKTVQETVDQLRGEISNAAELAGGETGTGRYLQNLEDWATIEHAARKGDLAESYIGLDRLKRTMQKKIDVVGRTLSNETNPFLLDQKRVITEQLEKAQEKLRTFLEDQGVWGKQGAAQQETNAGLSRWLRYKRFFDQSFMTQTGREYGGFGGGPILEADRDKVSAYIQNLGKKEGSLKDKVFREHLASTEQFVDAIGRNYEPGSAAASALDGVKKAAADIRSTMQKADTTVKTANQLDEITTAERGGVSMLGGAGFGFLGGGPLGALGGAIAGAVTHPGQLIRQAAAIRQIAARVDLQLGKSLAAFFTRATGKAQELVGAAKAAAASAARGVKQGTTVGSIAAFTAGHPSLDAAYRAHVAETLKANANHGAAIRANVGNMGDLPNLTPKLSQALVISATNAAGYLQSKIPAGLISPTVFQPTRPAPVDRAAAEKFARIWAAVNSPLTAMKDLEHGTMTRDQVDALKAVYPKLYEQVRTGALEMLRNLDMSGVRVPYRDKLQLDVLLDLGGAGEPTMDPGFALRVDSLRQQAKAAQAQAQEQASHAVPARIADATRTTLQRLEGQ